MRILWSEIIERPLKLVDSPALPKLSPTHRVPAGRWLWALSLCTLALSFGCSSPPPPPPAAVVPAVDLEQEPLRAEAATALQVPLRIVFDWEAREVGGLRVSGSGVARVEPPYRARLDLFLGNGELVAQAALVDGDLRLPPRTPEGILPPPHLLWGTLGVFRPGTDQTLLGGETVEGLLRLRYRISDQSEIHYYLARRRIDRVERLQGGTVVQRVEVERDDQAIPTTALYRDLATGQELKIVRTSVEQVEPYPPDIWLW